MLTVACVQTGNYCGLGAKYVNLLYEMVTRELTDECRFVCLTDDSSGLHKDIEVIEAPGERGWWNKLYLFEVLKGRTLYFDLDTCLAGSIDFLTEYQGRFAMLRDFYRPDGFGSGVMLWNDDLSFIWQKWVDSGKPELTGGDQEWIERVAKPEALQALFPGKIKSFKADLQFEPEAPVVCFHGHPKPHDVAEGWVKTLWQPGVIKPRWIDALNNDRSVMLDQFRENLKRPLPWFAGRPAHAKPLLLVGGGPSLQDTLSKLRFHHKRGEIWALNNTHDWLIARGIIPDAHVMLDSRQENTEFVRNPRKGVRYLISAFCHPDVFDALEGYDVTLWMSDMEGAQALVQGITHKPVVLVGGGASVGMKAMFLAHLDGFRKFHFFGFDSSYRGEENHAYRQALNDQESRAEIVAAGRTFICAPWMAKQAMEFQSQARELMRLGCRLYVHGDGLIPWIMETWNERRRREAVG